MKRGFYHVLQSCLWVLITQFVAIGLCTAAMQMMIGNAAWGSLVYMLGVLGPMLFALAGRLIPRGFMVASRKQLYVFVSVWLVAAVGFDVLVRLGYIVEAAEFICLPQQLTAAAVFGASQPGPVLQLGIHLMTMVYFGVGFWFKRRKLKQRGEM